MLAYLFFAACWPLSWQVPSRFLGSCRLLAARLKRQVASARSSVVRGARIPDGLRTDYPFAAGLLLPRLPLILVLGDTLLVHNEQALIAAFVKRNKRDRYREFLSNPRLRHKFIRGLAHFTDFDPQYRVPIPSNKLFVDNIAVELHKRHCPTFVFVISEDPALDNKELPLLQALRQVVGRGMGAVLSCIPGRLVFVETEDERFILERHDALEKREYVRFVVGRKDEDSHVEQGVFQAVARALEWRDITGSDADELNELQGWFCENLEKPSSFGRDKLRRGICWFKTSANEHISRIWQMVQILERNGIYVKKVKTDKPGYVVYQDEWQLVAEPFRKGTMPGK